MVVEVPGGCWCEQMVQVFFCGLAVANVSLLVFFCGPRFPCVRVAWPLGGLGFFVVLEVLVLLGDVWGLVFDSSIGLVASCRELRASYTS